MAYWFKLVRIGYL